MAAGKKKHLVKFGKAEKGGENRKHYFIIIILLIKLISILITQ